MKVWFLVKWIKNPYPKVWEEDVIGNFGILRIEALETYFAFVDVKKILPIKHGARSLELGYFTPFKDRLLKWYEKNRALGFPAPTPEELKTIIGEK